MNFAAIFLGLAAGVVGGMFGIGGGLIIVPALILLFGFDQKVATGTSLLAQLLPVGLLGVWEYHRNHQIQVVPGLWISAGLLLGAWAGSLIALSLSKEMMKQSYGIFLLVVGLYFLLSPSTPARKAAVPPAVEAPAPPE